MSETERTPIHPGLVPYSLPNITCLGPTAHLGWIATCLEQNQCVCHLNMHGMCLNKDQSQSGRLSVGKGADPDQLTASALGVGVGEEATSCKLGPPQCQKGGAPF